MQIIEGTEKDYDCDTLILSVGLIPENELSLKAEIKLDSRTKGAIVDENYQTSVPGIFACGNVLQVHDLVDYVSLEGERLATQVAKYVDNQSFDECNLDIITDDNINYTIPQKISGKNDFILSFRVRKPHKNCMIELLQNNQVIKTMKLKKAIPAEMIQIEVSKEDIKSDDDLKVVLR